MMSELHFIRPLWLLSLLPYAALLIWFYYRKRHAGLWTRYVEPQLQPYVLSGGEQGSRRRPLLLLALAGILAATALAGPAWEKLPQPVFKTQSALIVALDLSYSMHSQDISPSRLERAKLKTIDILNRRREGETALLVFAAEAFAVTPLTDDVNTIRAHVAELTPELMPAQGSRADLALTKAQTLFEQAGVQHGHVLLITDGVDPEKFRPALDALQAAGHRLSILGVGTAEGAPVPAPQGGFLKDRNGAIVLPKLNETELHALAPYRRLAIDDGDLDYLLPDSNPQLFQDSDISTELTSDVWRDEGPWLLLPLLLLAALSFRRGILCWLCLLFIPYSQPAHALSAGELWDKLWLNDNKRGEQAFESQDYGKATELFADPLWKSAAAYRQGDYQQAADLLQDLQDPEALYNRGNALAKLGNIEAAVDSYNQALQLNPEHADAKYNRDLLIQQQKKQPQSGQGDGQEQQSNEQQSAGEQRSPQQNNDRNGEQSDQQNAGQNQQQAGQQDSASNENSTAENDEHRDRAGEKAGGQNKESADKRAQQQQTAGDDSQDQSGEKSEQAAGEQTAQRENTEQNRALEQWLRRVPDDPGGLLKRKFLYQYRQQQHEPEKQQW
jgi:Ca-activated chloride channel family protein